MGSLVWAGAAPKPPAGSSDGDTGIEVLSQVVTWLVLMWFREANRDKNRVCDALVFFFQAEDGIRDRSPSRGLGDVYKRQIRALGGGKAESRFDALSSQLRPGRSRTQV